MLYVPLCKLVVVVSEVGIRELPTVSQPGSLKWEKVSWPIEKGSAMWVSPWNCALTLSPSKSWYRDFDLFCDSELAIDSLEWSENDTFILEGRDCLGLGITALPQIKNPVFVLPHGTNTQIRRSALNLPGTESGLCCTMNHKVLEWGTSCK